MKTLYHETIHGLCKIYSNQTKILHDVLEMHPFILMDLKNVKKEDLTQSVDNNTILDLPFESVFMELPVSLIEGCDSDFAIGVTERHPGQYTIWQFHLSERGVDITWVNNDQPNDMENQSRYLKRLAIAKAYVDSLNRKNTYLAKEKTGRKKSIRNGKKKTYLDIKPIIYVVDKKTYNEKPASLGHNIDWSHKFEVRGHWRKIKSIGKNRFGVYCIKNFTWIKNHIKGKGDLVKKTRVVL